jgi:hypothetical protein
LRAVARAAIRAGALQDRARRRPGALALVLGAAVFALGLGIFRLRLDNRLEVWTDAGARRADDFDRRDFAAVLHDGPAVESGGFDERDRRLSERLAAIPGVAEIESVSLALRRLGKRTLADLGDGAAFFDDYLLAAGRRSAAIRLWLEEGAHRGAVVAAIEERLSSSPDAAVVLGPAAFNAALDDRSRLESAKVLPLAAAVAAAALAAVLGSVRNALLAAGTASLGVAAFLGALGWMGTRLNFLSMNVAVILAVAELSLMVHPLQLISESLRRRRPGGVSMQRVSLRSLPGSALAVLTSAAGFLTLSAAPSAAVRQFGALGAAAMAAALASSVLSLPLVAGLAAPSGPRAAGRQERLRLALASLGRRIERRPLMSGWGLAALLSLGAFLALRIPVDHEPLDFLSKEDPLRRAYEAAGAKGGGLAPLEFTLEIPGGCWSLEGLRALDRAASAMAQAAGAGRAFSIARLVELSSSMLQGGRAGSCSLPSSDAALGAALAALRALGGGLGGLASADGTRCRVILPLPLMGGGAFATARARAGDSLKAHPGVRGRPCGLIHDLMAVQDGILASQARGLALGIAGACIVLGAVFGTIEATLAALMVNLLPLSLAAALMGLARIPLDLSSAMVAGVSLGISVDDSARFLWRHGRWGGREARGAADLLRHAGMPTVGTGSLLAAGFAALGCAGFPPIARFGLLTAAALVLAVLSHVFILPGLLCRPSRARASGATGERHACHRIPVPGAVRVT